MKLLVMSGGRHPYEESTPILEGFLEGAGHDVTSMEDASILADAEGMNTYDALVFNTRRENLPDFGDWELAASEKEGLKSYIRGGKGFGVGRIRRSHWWRLGYGHQLSPALRRDGS